MFSPSAHALEPIELLGKNIFFDTSLSTPGNKQGCVSCHEPTKGWVFPDSAVNAKTVVAPGAAPHRQGGIKPPANAYASLSPPFRAFTLPSLPPPAPPIPPQALPGFGGGNFWNGRAEGCGTNNLQGTCTGMIAGDVDKDVVSETLTAAVLPTSTPGSTYGRYLGPTADQALNPFPKGVEQNAGEKKVCTQVKTAKYKALYFDAYKEQIDCGPTGVHKSFQRIALALAAWQKSTDVVPFQSKRDKILRQEPGVTFTTLEQQGRDLFYGKGNCSLCHSGLANQLALGLAPDDPTGAEVKNLYTDHKYHNIGTPFNREIPNVAAGGKRGLSEHIINQTKVADGFFKTPTVRNVAKGLDGSGKGKAYAHNGWFKKLETIVHFYNTRDVLPKCDELSSPIINATEAEATNPDGSIKCWPKAEFPGFVTPIVGNLQLLPDEEKAIVAYLKALSDDFTPTPP